MKMNKLEKHFLQQLRDKSGTALADAWQQQSSLQHKVRDGPFI